MQQILGVIGVIAAILSYALFKGWQLKRERKKNAILQAEKQQQAVEIEQKKAEVKYAYISKKNNEKVTRSSASDIDDKLQQHGYFRDNNRLHGVQSDLSEPCGYAGNETSDSCSQSDF